LPVLGVSSIFENIEKNIQSSMNLHVDVICPRMRFRKCSQRHSKVKTSKIFWGKTIRTPFLVNENYCIDYF
jgi:hypothetical protein